MYFENEIITSRNNQLVKWAASLSDKKYRKESGYFMAEGIKLTLEAFESSLPIDYCFVSLSKKELAYDLLSRFENDVKYEKCKIITVSDNVFEKISIKKDFLQEISGPKISCLVINQNQIVSIKPYVDNQTAIKHEPLKNVLKSFSEIEKIANGNIPTY